VQEKKANSSEEILPLLGESKSIIDSPLLYGLNRKHEGGYKYHPSSSAENSSLIPELIRLLIPSQVYGESLITPFFPLLR
jgi:hypothetical protein